MDITLQNYDCLIYLVSCALNSAVPEEAVLKDVDLEKLFHRAQRHSVVAMVCMVLEKTEAFAAAAEEVRKQWQEAKNKAIRKIMLLDAERGAILSQLEAEGIWYMPLKGSILKDWYPKPGMREMTDNDILFDESKRDRVREIFRQRGYKVMAYDRGHHDMCEKPPVYNFEMHLALFVENEEEYTKQYRNIQDRLLPVDGTAYQYAFTPEDFYVFAIAHAYKHYSAVGGTGIRTLADIYVMNRHLNGTMSRSKAEQLLEKSGIAEYERASRLLAQKLFSQARPLEEMDLTPAEEELLRFYCGSSTYGTIENKVSHDLHTLQKTGGAVSFGTKLQYFCSRLFPGREYCKCLYPFVYDHPYLLPFFWVWRLAARGIPGRKRIKREMASIKKCK